MCFEILGFDVLIDDKLKPWLIEINHAPSFSTDTPLDFKMKKDVVADAIQLLGMTYKRKKKIIKSHKSNINKRMLMVKKTAKKESVPSTNKTAKMSSVTSPKVSKTKENDPLLESMCFGSKAAEASGPMAVTSPSKKEKGDDSESEDMEADSEYRNKYRIIYPSNRNTPH